MKCPKCKQELKEGQLYCENCGEEIKMVPVFDPEIENSIEETLLNVAEDISVDEEIISETEKAEPINNVFSSYERRKERLLIDDFSEEELLDDSEYIDDLDDIEDEELPDEDFWDVDEVIHFQEEGNFINIISDFWKKSIFSKIIVFITGLACVGLLVFIGVFITRHVQNNSYSYQVEQAMQAAEKEEYDTAILYLENALTIDSSDINMKYLLADYYLKINEVENALLVLRGNINGNTEEDITTYEKIFNIYSQQGKIVEISRILSECEDEVILERFQQYVANPPEFSITAGKYDEVMHLKLTAGTSGTIYYTVNGGEPTVDSDEYTAPIFLESGAYTVQAIFVNAYGLVSEVASAQYEIDVLVPPAPEISLESGTYELPELITVTVPEDCTTYYTTDGTMPTQDSLQYKEPICMPLGDSKFTFITYSSDNVASEASIAMYSLKLAEYPVSAADAANRVTMYRFGMGGLMDTQGHLSTISGKLLYMCEAAVTMQDDVYYVVYEYYEDPNSQLRTRTGLVFCASMTDSSKVGEMELDEFGQYYLVEPVQ